MAYKCPVIAFSEALTGSLEDAGVNIESKGAYLSQLKSCLPWFDSMLRRVEVLVTSKIDEHPIPVSKQLISTLI